MAALLHDVIWGQSLPELFRMGGPVMWPILVCSVLALAIIAERCLVFLFIGRVPRRLATKAAEHVAHGRASEARALLGRSRHPAARVFERQVELAGRSGAPREEILQREGGLLIERLEARLSPLQLIAQIAPLLGLLGTVSGLVESFWDLEQISGPVEPSDLAAGIWAALLTTVFGLVVGIPASAAAHLLSDRVSGFARHLGFGVTQLEEAALRASEAGAAPAAGNAPTSEPTTARLAAN
ncbi:MAG: MotA/TolQ/ExbB proton channel family protein [Planctomycetota bacterium]